MGRRGPGANATCLAWCTRVVDSYQRAETEVDALGTAPATRWMPLEAARESVTPEQHGALAEYESNVPRRRPDGRKEAPTNPTIRTRLWVEM